MDCLQTLCCWQTTLHRIQWFRLKTNIFQSTNVSHWRHTLDVKMSLKHCFYALDIDCSPFLWIILQMKINKVVLKFCFISSTWVESMKNYKFSRKEKQHELSSGGKILLVYRNNPFLSGPFIPMDPWNCCVLWQLETMWEERIKDWVLSVNLEKIDCSVSSSIFVNRYVNNNKNTIFNFLTKWLPTY